VCEEGEEKCEVCRTADGAEDDEEVEEASESGESSESSKDGSHNKEEMDTVEAERDEARRVFEQQQLAQCGPRQTLIQQRQQAFADMEWLRRQLAWWIKRCGICKAAGEGESGHDVRKCWREESREAKEMIQVVEEKIQFEAYTGCFWCGVPQEVCNRWEDNGRGRYQRAKGGDCQYRGVLVGGLFGLVCGSKNGVAEQWVARLAKQGIQGGSVEVLAQHLGRKQAFECVESNRLVEEFCWVTRLMAE
jgi:hypothetical protein